MTELNLVESLREHAYHLARGEIVDVRGLEKVIREAADILAKLPTTADGVVITPGMSLWQPDWCDPEEPPRLVDGVRMDTFPDCAAFEDCYSTESAARAAAEGKQDVDR
jgi:hypothetical protein